MAKKREVTKRNTLEWFVLLAEGIKPDTPYTLTANEVEYMRLTGEHIKAYLEGLSRCGRPRQYKNNAERQKAYRERKAKE